MPTGHYIRKPRVNPVFNPRYDLTGARSGRLLCVKAVGRTKSRSIVWECRCDCGNISNVPSYAITAKSIKSCGCLMHEWGDYPGLDSEG